MRFQITLQHNKYNDNEILYNGNSFDDVDLTVTSGDELIFNAVGADWRILLFVSDGDFDHSEIIVKQGASEIINVNLAPHEGAIFEASCLSCEEVSVNGDYSLPVPPPPLEAPKKIIVIRAGMTVDRIQSMISNKVKKLVITKDLLHDFKIK
ncbi:MAG: hypothetical protein IPJ23_12085 [Ignavibacteriales bacterium]|nr:hypothetical protein [Ignavibacteriales bacterium]